MASNQGKRKTQNTVVKARARLRGDLNDLFEDTDNSMCDDTQDGRQAVGSIPIRGRPSKRQAEVNRITTQSSTGRIQNMHKTPNKSVNKNKSQKERNASAHDSKDSDSDKHSDAKNSNNGATTTVLKVFDRSIDLSNYDESTPLYPMCCAWVKNAPHSTEIPNFRNAPELQIPKRELDGAELYRQLKSGEISEIFEMPRPLETTLPRIPSFKKSEYDLDAIDAALAAGASGNWQNIGDLQKENKIRWTAVRQKWLKQSNEYLFARFRYSYLIFKYIQNKNKSMGKRIP